MYIQYEELKATLSQLRAELAEKERALIAARTAAHSTNMSSQEVCTYVTDLYVHVYNTYRGEGECMRADFFMCKFLENNN